MFVSQEAEEGSNKASRGRDLWGRGAVEKPKESADHRIKKRCIGPGFLRIMWSSSEETFREHISESCVRSFPDSEWSGVAMKNREYN